MGQVVERLRAKGFDLPEAARPVAAYVPALVSGRDAMTSGQLPMWDGKLPKTGKLGENVSIEEGRGFAQRAALNALAALAQAAGDLDRVEQVLRVVVYVASAPGFTQQPQVANGASELLELAFGQAGRHTRSAVGVSELPLGAPVEVEVWVRLSE